MKNTPIRSKVIQLVGALAVGACCTSAEANSYRIFAGNGGLHGGERDDFHMDWFDPELGHLDRVVFEATANVRGHWRFSNYSPTVSDLALSFTWTAAVIGYANLGPATVSQTWTLGGAHPSDSGYEPYERGGGFSLSQSAPEVSIPGDERFISDESKPLFLSLSFNPGLSFSFDPQINQSGHVYPEQYNLEVSAFYEYSTPSVPEESNPYLAVALLLPFAAGLIPRLRRAGITH